MTASEAIASGFVSAIEAAFEPVRHFPLAAPAREQLAPGLRVTFHRRYAIYYRPMPDAVVIVRVLHRARREIELHPVVLRNRHPAPRAVPRLADAWHDGRFGHPVHFLFIPKRRFIVAGIIGSA